MKNYLTSALGWRKSPWALKEVVMIFRKKEEAKIH